jgi:SAM-dependent methyltransferase
MVTSARPEPFSAFTTPEFWDDPHISAQMLGHHLDPVSPAASRPHEFIDRSAHWLRAVLGLGPGSRVIDLGCGPGLYASRLARHGVQVLGVDVSARSLAHAHATAVRGGLAIRLVHGSYLDVDLGADHDAAILIYEDYCTLSPTQRALLLTRIHAALRPGGQFLFDVTSAARFAEFSDSVRAEDDLMDGFWAPRPYHATHETWTYPAERLVLDRFTIDTAESTRVFWNWTHCLSLEAVADELEAAGLTVADTYGDVAGAPYDPAGHTFAVRAHRQ